MTVKQVLTKQVNHYIDYLKQPIEYRLNKILVYDAAGTGRMDFDTNMDAEVKDYFIDENNTICIYI